MTTLLDDKQCRKEDIAELYGLRWLVEVDLRTLKITMGMDILRCKSPSMVEKEVMMYCTAYNLMRGPMLEASPKAQCGVRQLSFKGVMALAVNWTPQMIHAASEEQAMELRETLLECIGSEVVRSTKGRVQPRPTKRRPKNYQRLTSDRHEWRKDKDFRELFPLKLCQEQKHL